MLYNPHIAKRCLLEMLRKNMCKAMMSFGRLSFFTLFKPVLYNQEAYCKHTSNKYSPDGWSANTTDNGHKREEADE